MSGDGASATRDAIEAVWRIESARLIGGLVRIVRDVALAEDLAQEALLAAMERWPVTGDPREPGRVADDDGPEARARPEELCEEALRLGALLAELVPREAEAHGLVALMELHASRLRARVGPSGEPILLLEQDRSRWDQLLLHCGLAALARAQALSQPLGPYGLQAAIAGCHACARTAAETDWPRIVALYDAPVEVTGSPVVELKRAVAVSMAFGPAAGLDLADALLDEPSLASYHLLPSVRGDLLAKLGRHREARAAFERAAELAGSARAPAAAGAREGGRGASEGDRGCGRRVGAPALARRGSPSGRAPPRT